MTLRLVLAPFLAFGYQNGLKCGRVRRNYRRTLPVQVPHLLHCRIYNPAFGGSPVYFTITKLSVLTVEPI